MHRKVGEKGFVDQLLERRSARKEHLRRIASLIDWSVLEKLLSDNHSHSAGRPGYPGLVLFKALLLQSWYGLSDPGLEEALDDTLSFRDFVGLSLEDPVPDHSTLWRFREALVKRGLSERLFAEINRQLEAQHLLVKAGTLIDATLVEAQAKKPPISAGGGAKSLTDQDAAWTRKNGKSHFGYKAHIGADQTSGLIRKAQLTPGNVNDTEVADALIMGDEAAVYADKAYASKARRSKLKSLGIKDRIMHRGNKHQKRLPVWQAMRNKLIAPIRAAVERVFGTLKRSYGYRRVRFFTLGRNDAQLQLLCAAFNLRRALSLHA
jgi:IS5 family transposase